MAAFSTGGVLLAGACLLALLRHRRRQFRYRRPGRAISTAPAELAGMEKALLGVGHGDVSWLNAALRGLAHRMAADPAARLPDVAAACLTAEGLQLLLATPRTGAPAPWTASPDATSWHLARGADTGFDPTRADWHYAPYPALVSIGYTGAGQYWLLDLEHARTLALTGPRDRCLDLARFLAAELAHNPWSEQLQVTLAGVGGELVGLNPDRIDIVDDVDQAASALHRQLQANVEILDQAGVDVLQGRLRDVIADQWVPHILLAAPHAGSHQQIQQLQQAIHSRPGRSAVTVLLTGHQPAPGAGVWQLHLDPAGTLRVPRLGLELMAQQLPAHEAAQLARLLGIAARTDDRPMPDARGDAPWDALADAAGGLRTSLVTTPGPATTGAADLPHLVSLPDDVPLPDDHPDRSAAAAPTADTLLPLAQHTVLETTASTPQDVEALAPHVSVQVRQQIHDADPALDADLAAWHDPDSTVPRLTLLGTLDVRAAGSLPQARPRKAWNIEVVAYLACHPRGVTAEQLGTDLWPGDPDITSKSKPRQAISIVRKWLGTEYLPPAGNVRAGTGLYRLQGVLIDAELFRRLRLRGVSRGADGIPDLQAALDLVTGPPFDGPRPGGYAWLAESPIDHEYTAMIVDVAHIVATHHLATGRPDLAADAAQVALRAGSSDDIALLDLVAAHDAQGNRAAADALVARILATHNAEVEEDLPPRTAEVLHRRRWLDRAS